MSALEMYQFGTKVEVFGALVLWLVILARAPLALRSRQQRLLLFAVAGIAVSITVYLDPVTAFLNRSFIFGHSCGLFMNVWGVIDSALILDFVLAATSRRRPRLVYGVMAVASTALVVLDQTIAPNAGCVNTQAVPWYSPFWWILVSAHLVATVPCATLCARYGYRAREDRSLRAGLTLLALGFTSSSVFWTVVLAYLLARPAWLGALFPLNIGFTAWLMACGACLPLALAAGATARDLASVWRLWPLWRDLVTAVPQVALAQPRPRLLAVVGAPRSIRLRLYRQVIEIRDAIMILRDYVSPSAMERARQEVDAGRIAPRQAEPRAMARWLDAALLAKAAGATPTPNPLPVADGPGDGLGEGLGDGPGEGLSGEVDFLLRLCRARAAQQPPRLTLTRPRAQADGHVGAPLPTRSRSGS